MSLSSPLASLLLALLPLSGSAQNTEGRATTLPGRSELRPAGCLSDGSGYFRARIRGAMNIDLDWRNADLECEGGARQDEGGIRVSFAGPLPSAGRLRLVFGISRAREGSSGHALPTNLTVIVEGARRLFSTRGDDKCTVDSVRQQPSGIAGGGAPVYRIVARGFCTGPASGITRNERIVVTQFDFAGRIVFDR